MAWCEYVITIPNQAHDWRTAQWVPTTTMSAAVTTNFAKAVRISSGSLRCH